MGYCPTGFESSSAIAETPVAVERPARFASPEARAAARRVASALENCLAMPDLPELSYLRCFVRMAFEEASTLGAIGQPSDADLAYLEKLQRETRDYRARVRHSRPTRALAEI
jgi:hypothetical protein